jgi:hypothetical protein
MRRLCRFFIILILACTVAACSDEGGGTSEAIFCVTPIKQKYIVDEIFVPINDMLLFTLSDKGEKQDVTINNQVTISLAKLPYLPEEDEMIVVQYDTGYKLGTAGSNVVYLEYEGMSASYFIEVSDASAGTGSTSPGIKIEWAK